jgi:DNA polymerase/3'-5' exonuclease PolX
MLAFPTQTTIKQEEPATLEVDLLSRNKELADILELISSYYIMVRDTYRAKAFSNASAKIAAHPIAIISGAQARNELTGIGDSIQAAIDEFISSYEQNGVGTVKRLQELEQRFADRKVTIDLFRSIFGIGPTRAVQFYEQGFRTLEDLWYKAPLVSAQRLGILWRLHINQRIPRDELDLINEKIGYILNH